MYPNDIFSRDASNFLVDTDLGLPGITPGIPQPSYATGVGVTCFTSFNIVRVTP